jgi:hypothetical protein
MGAFRDYFDVVGGARSGLSDDPPWWAPVAIGAFGVLVAVVIGVSFLLGIDGDRSAESARRDAAAPTATQPVSPPGPPGAQQAAAGGGGADPGETVALADRQGTFQQVPRGAVAAARDYGAAGLGLPVGEVRHQLITAAPGRFEFTVSSLDGKRQLRVATVESAGGWQAS